MPERRPATAIAIALFALSWLLVAGCWFDVGSAGPLAWLAQAPMALGIALLRGTNRGSRLGRDVVALALAWGGGFLLAVVLAAWPLQALRAAPELLPVLAMMTAVLGLNALGDGLRHELDPVVRR